MSRAGFAALAALAAVGAALALAACGAGEKPRLTHAQEEQALRSAYGAVRGAFRQTRVDSLGALDSRLAAAQAQLRHAADRLEAAEAPGDVGRPHEELVEGLRAYAEDLNELRAAARAGDRTRIAAFNARIGDNEAAERIAESLEEINHAGYDLGDVKLD